MKVGVPYSYNLYYEGYNSTPKYGSHGISGVISPYENNWHSPGPEIFLAAPTKTPRRRGVTEEIPPTHLVNEMIYLYGGEFWCLGNRVGFHS